MISHLSPELCLQHILIKNIKHFHSTLTGGKINQSFSVVNFLLLNKITK